MKRRIDKVVVLGAGTMGARIAAHFANAGVSCVLLDIVPPSLPPDAGSGARNKIVAAGLDAAKKSRPAAAHGRQFNGNIPPPKGGQSSAQGSNLVGCGSG